MKFYFSDNNENFPNMISLFSSNFQKVNFSIFIKNKIDNGM